MLGAAIAIPLAATTPGAGLARAAEISMPRNQSEFDQFAAQLDNAGVAQRVAQLNRAGNAFDNGESRLFWFTDLEAARAQAERENKPILSLRLLGNLSDELSCANSRLFRVLLYPNAEINRRLHDDFVLHWSSERPVPVATIDMGDGRVFKRTLTGNSAHYLLSADGMPLDALPGLYAPAEFEKWLQTGADFARDWRAMKVESQPQMLSDWHRRRLIEGIKAQPSGDLKWVTQLESEADLIIAANALRSDKFTAPYTNARAASELTGSKRTMEMPVLNAIESFQTTALDAGRQNYIPLTGDIPLMGRLFRSKTLAEAQNSKPSIFDAATRARIAAMQPEDDAKSLIQTLERNVARDTQNNRRNFEPAIHAYFVNQATPDSFNQGEFSSGTSINPFLSNSTTSGFVKPEPSGARKNSQFGGSAAPLAHNREIANELKPDFVKLNRAIYDKLFRTPASDPWLGLAPPDEFVALHNGGVRNAESSQSVAQKP